MVRLGVVSDSHNSQFWLERFAAKCAKEKYDCVFHLGDLYGDARWLEKHIDRPLIAVTGNCDYFTKRGAPMARASFGGRQIIAVHGHMQNVKYGYDQLSYYAEDAGAEVALFGHTHEPVAGWVGRVLLFNPGALMDGCYGELLLDGARMVPYLKRLDEEG